MKRWRLAAERCEQKLHSRKAEALVALALFVVATVIRLVFIEAHGLAERVYSDMWVYDFRAKNIVNGTLNEWDTFTPPGYPSMLALLYVTTRDGVAAAGVVQAFLGGATSVLSQRLTIQVTNSRLLGLLAGVVIALHPPYIYYAGLLLSEMPFTFFMLLGASLFIPGVRQSSAPRLLAAGLAFGVATVMRPNLLPAVPLLLAIAWLCSAQKQAALGPRVLLVLGLLLPLSLASIHNSRLVKEKAGLATNGGLNFYLNFAEVSIIHFEGHHIQPIPNAVRHTEPETTNHPFYHERYFYKKGFQVIRNEPGRLLAAFDNFPETFLLGEQGYWPEWGKESPGFMLLNIPFILLIWFPALIHGARLLFSRRLLRERDPARPLLIAVILSMLVTIYLFLGDPRMRVPFDAVALALALDALAGYLRTTDREASAT
ncbi:MAG TPA: hypothetical protein VK524_25280 [Polyangiaceae bacterium]|nr:hypothetical protein [Polyangiaceae bacterium]